MDVPRTSRKDLNECRTVIMMQLAVLVVADTLDFTVEKDNVCGSAFAMTQAGRADNN
jgi:hypothetical protein